MGCLFWNCRGLGNPRKVPTLKKEVLHKDLSFVFLCETKLCVRELEGVSRKLGFDCCFGVYCDCSGKGRSGGLGLLWKFDLMVSVRSFSLNHIDFTMEDEVEWRLTGIYGHPEDNQKWRTWMLLDMLGVDFTWKWLCVGDFNEVLYGYEKMGGIPRAEGRMIESRECLERNRLNDMGYTGHAYTWSNKQSYSCLETFPSFRVSHLTRFMSDHYPIVVEWREIPADSMQERKRPFRFKAVWLGEQACTSIIENVWAQDSALGVTHLAANLHLCGNELHVWGENDFGNIKKEIRTCNKELKRMQRAYQDVDTVQKINILEKHLPGLYRMDEIYWLQRSRISWMRE
ncbi:hypothetical protein ACS0TY_029271 [Phlomoides rotata]